MPALRGFRRRRLLARKQNRKASPLTGISAVDPELAGDLADKRLDDFHSQPAGTGGGEIFRQPRALVGYRERMALRRRFEADRNRARPVFDGIGHQFIDDESEGY